jgi:hypothetical protein
MHKRMTRFLSALSLLVVIPVVANASTARLAGMNVPGDYVKDYTGMFTYVSGVGSVGNMVYVEPNVGLGQGGQAMGAVLGNLFEGRLGTWAINMRQFSPTLGQPTAFGSVTTTDDASTFGDPNLTGEAFDVMWGHKMGSGSLGLRLSRSFVSFEDNTGTEEGNGNNGRNLWGLGAGFGFAMNSNTDVEIAGQFQNRNWQAAPPSTAADDGGSTYLITGRAMMKSGGNLMWVPVARVYSFDLSSIDAGGAATDEKISGWEVGGAGNWSIGSDDMLVLGLQIVGNRHETTAGTAATVTDRETFYPNVFAGLETHVNNWLTVRFGARNAALYSLRTETGATTTTDKHHVFNFNMGAGVKLGSLMLDATLDQGFWNNPVSSVWNSSGGPDPFPHVSATYSF